MKRKLGSIGAAVAVLVGLLVWHNNGRERIHGTDVGAAPFAHIQACADSFSDHNPDIRRETQAHLVNGGYVATSLDSLHLILGDRQPVAAITHVVIDPTNRDTVITVFYAAPPVADVLEHETANAFAWRHRRTLIGSDTGKFQTSAFFRACVRYCPRCNGAY